MAFRADRRHLGSRACIGRRISHFLVLRVCSGGRSQRWSRQQRLRNDDGAGNEPERKSGICCARLLGSLVVGDLLCNADISGHKKNYREPAGLIRLNPCASASERHGWKLVCKRPFAEPPRHRIRREPHPCFRHVPERRLAAMAWRRGPASLVFAPDVPAVSRSRVRTLKSARSALAVRTVKKLSPSVHPAKKLRSSPPKTRAAPRPQAVPSTSSPAGRRCRNPRSWGRWSPSRPKAA